MDPTVKNYLMQKYGQSWINPPVQQPAFNMVAPENMVPAQQPPPPVPFMMDPANQIPEPAPEVSAPAPAPVQHAIASAPEVPEINHDTGILSDADLKRYGIRSPEQLEALRQQRLQMGNDLAKQGDANVLAKLLATAGDNVAATGNRIQAGNMSNAAPGVGAALDENLKAQQAKVSAFDDANEKIGESDYKRLADVDDKRLKIQQMRDASKERSEDRKVMREQTAAYRESQHSDKLSKQDEDMQKKYSEALNFDKASSRSPLGMAANNIVRAKNVLGLLSKPVTGPDRHLIANDLNTMVSGLSNVSGANASQYNSLASKAKDMVNYLEGDTQNTLPEAQRIHMQQQIKELYNNMAAVIKSHKKVADIGFQPLLARHPELSQQYDNQIEDMIGLPKEQAASQINPDVKMIGNHQYQRTENGWKLVK